MKAYLLIMTIFFSQLALAQGEDGFLFGGEEPAAEVIKEEPKPKPDPAPAKPVVKVEEPAVVAPTWDVKFADVLCSQGKFTSLGTNSGPDRNDAEDIVSGLFGISGPLNRIIMQTSGMKAGEAPGKFGITHRENVLQIGLPGRGAFNSTVFLPAKMCVKDDKTIMAYLDASGVAFGPKEPIPLTIQNLGGGAVKIVGSADGSAPLAGTFKMTADALK